MRKTAVIFGICGQDGSYLAELLLEKDYKVVGVGRRASSPNTGRIDHLLTNPSLAYVEGDVTDPGSVLQILKSAGPCEVYNLAGQSHVKTSFDQPAYTSQVCFQGTLNILEAINFLESVRGGYRFYQASTSEMFGSSYSLRWTEFGTKHYDFTTEPVRGAYAETAFQNEETPMLPNSPYAIAKLAAHHLCRLYRDSYGIFACSGILFNHESPRRGELFVTKKISKFMAKLAVHGFTEKLRLGNLDAQRDWGSAKDYVRAMWLMLQQEKPDDFVVATGEAHSVRDFVEASLKAIGSDLKLEDVVEVDPAFYRPCEVPFLRGDASKAARVLSWRPESSFDDLVREMVHFDIEQERAQTSNRVISTLRNTSVGDSKFTNATSSPASSQAVPVGASS